MTMVFPPSSGAVFIIFAGRHEDRYNVLQQQNALIRHIIMRRVAVDVVSFGICTLNQVNSDFSVIKAIHKMSDELMKREKTWRDAGYRVL